MATCHGSLGPDCDDWLSSTTALADGSPMQSVAPAPQVLADPNSIAPDFIARAGVAVGLVVALVGIGVWLVFLGRKRLIQDLPTSSTRGVALGLNELMGRAESEESVPSPQSGVECVWWKNEFYVENDDNGWKKTGEKVGGPIAFRLVDDDGDIEVRPRRAEVQGRETYDGPYSLLQPTVDPNPTLASRHLAARTLGTKRRRVVERVIPVGADVYVLGTAQLPYEGLTPLIGQDRHGQHRFIVRVGTEADALYVERVGVGMGFVAAMVGAIAAAVAWHDGEALAAETITWSQISPWGPAAGIVFALMVMSALSIVFTYNGLVLLRERVQTAWSLIDIQLRRRHDLIPSLAEVVRAHAAHESEVQRAVAELRSTLASDLPAKPTDEAVHTAERQIRAETAAMHRVLALVEAYPTLTADESFAGLRAALIDTEDRIALARGFYNASVQALHDRAQAVPGNFVAALFGLDLDAEFTVTRDAAPAAAAEPPRVAGVDFPTSLPPAALARRLRT
jgi:hypothetical protein